MTFEVAMIFLVVVVVVIIYNVSKQKPSNTSAPSRPKPKPVSSPNKPSHHGRSKYVICKINGEMLSMDEADRIIADKHPLRTRVIIYNPQYKRTMKLLESLKVGDYLKMDYKTWTEGEGDRERDFYAIQFKTIDGTPIGALDKDEKREVAIKFDHINRCVISSIELTPSPRLIVTIDYK